MLNMIYSFNLGLRASLKASPKRLIDNTKKNIANPGIKACSGCSLNFGRAILTCIPQLIVFEGSPNPRNANPASDKIPPATNKAPITIIGVNTFGRT